jgi:hypothetical protein
VRVLVTVSPQMYRQAVAASIQRARPGIEVRIAPPEDTEEQLRLFRPELLLYDDTTPIPEEALEGIPARVEVLYSDSMDARVRADGMVSRISDMSTEDLLRTVAVAASLEDRT